MKVGIIKDRSKPMLGLHGHQTAFLGLPDVEICAFVDGNPKDRDVNMAITQAKRHYETYQEMLEKEELDIVQICSRHPSDHLPQIRDLAERGIHIYESHLSERTIHFPLDDSANPFEKEG